MSTLIKPQLSEPTLKKPITETWAYSSFAALAWLGIAADAAAWLPAAGVAIVSFCQNA